MVQLCQSPFALNGIAAISSSWPVLECMGGAGCRCTEWGGKEQAHSSLSHHPQSDSVLIVTENWIFFIIFELSKVFVVLSQGKVHLKCVWKTMLLGGRIANRDLVTIKWDWEGARCQKRGCKGASSFQCLKDSWEVVGPEVTDSELENLVVPTNVWKSACCKAWNKLYDIFLSKAKGIYSKLP